MAIERCDGPLVEALLEAGLRVCRDHPAPGQGAAVPLLGLGREVRRRGRLPARRRAAHRRAPPRPADPRQRGHSWSCARSVADPQAARRGPRRAGQPAARRSSNACFPGAIGLFARLDSDVAIAFLRRYPTQHAAARAYPGPLRRVPAPHLLLRPHTRHELFARVADAPTAGLTAAEADGPRRLRAGACCRAIETTRREERELEAEIIERLDAHADAHIFTSLPKAGHGVRAATAARRDRRRPRPLPRRRIPRRPGRRRPRHPRHRQMPTPSDSAGPADKKLRNAIIDFADDSRHASPWAAKIYTRRHHPRQTTPPRCPHPRPRLGPRHLALLASDTTPPGFGSDSDGAGRARRCGRGRTATRSPRSTSGRADCGGHSAGAARRGSATPS